MVPDRLVKDRWVVAWALAAPVAVGASATDLALASEELAISMGGGTGPAGVGVPGEAAMVRLSGERLCLALEDEVNALKQEASSLQNALDAINKRLSELEGA